MQEDARFDFLEEDFNIELQWKHNMTFLKNLHVFGKKYNINPLMFAKYLDDIFLERVKWSESKNELSLHGICDEITMYEFLRNFLNEIVVCQQCGTLHTTFNDKFTLRFCKSCLKTIEIFSQTNKQKSKQEDD